MWFLGISFLYLISRLFRLGVLPVFGDEAVYLHWISLISRDLTNAYIPLCDYKQPLYFIIASPFYRLFSDPLLSGRFVSVLCGLMNLTAVYCIGRAVLSRAAGMTAAVLYLSNYYLFQYDRHVNPEILVATFALFVLFAAHKVIQGENSGWLSALALGILLGGGIIVKNVFFTVWLFPVILLLFAGKKERIKFVCASYLIGLSFLLVEKIYPDTFQFKKAKFLIFFDGTPHNLIGHWSTNIEMVAEMFRTYLAWPGVILLILSYALIFTRGNLFLKALCVFVVLNLAGYLMLGIRLHSRYFVTIMSCLCIVASYAFHELAKLKRGNVVRIAFLFLTVINPVLFIAGFISNPIHARLTEVDRVQYITGQLSGYGIDEVISYLNERAKVKKIHVFVSNNYGISSDAVMVYLDHNPNIEVVPSWWYRDAPVILPGAMVDMPRTKFERDAWQNSYALDMTKIEEAYFVSKECMYRTELFLKKNPQAEKVMSIGKPLAENDDNNVNVFRLL